MLTALVAASALIPALVGAAAGAPRRLAIPLRSLRRPLAVALLLVGVLRAPTSAATPLPANRLESEVDPVPESDQIPAEVLPAGSYVVQPGDSLWAIACRTLTDRIGAAAADEDVDHLWKIIYRANRDLIGPEPDLIFPGQQLVLPEEV